LPSYLLALEFLGQFTLEAFLLSRFQEKGVLLDLLDNAFLLDLSLETTQGALNRFTVKYPDFCQNVLRKVCVPT